MNIFYCNSFVLNKNNIFKRKYNIVKSINVYDDSPSNIAKKYMIRIQHMGIENYGNFINNLNDKIESVTLLTQNEDIRELYQSIIFINLNMTL